jgi:sterol desaturase/sphingolipid hydroxylase (fatty acid hydroxylase superfamily)
MGLPDLILLLKWERSKYIYRGLGNIIGLLFYISYLYFVPLLFHHILSLLTSSSLYSLYTFGTYFTHLFGYLFINLIYFFLYTAKSKEIESRKISSGPWPWQNNPENPPIWNLIRLALLNQLIALPVAVAIFGLTAKYDISSRIPSFSEVLAQFLLFLLAEDFAFYWSHRALHTPWLYKHVHKVHHEYNVSISAAAEYAHPAEYILGNSLPTALGPLILGQSKVHIATWFTWVLFRTLNTAEGHSGYDFPWCPFRLFPLGSSSSFHDYHHFKNQGNFGSFFVIWDTICGTNQQFMKEFEKGEKKE